MALPKTEGKSWVRENLLPNQDNWLKWAYAFFLGLPVAGIILYRRGNLLAGRILIGLFILLILINLLGTSEIGAKK